MTVLTKTVIPSAARPATFCGSVHVRGARTRGGGGTGAGVLPDQTLRQPGFPGATGGRSGRQEVGGRAYSIDAANEFDPMFEDVYAWCETQGLDIDTLIHEEGTAQMEINFRHGPLTLADHIFVSNGR